jgi:hypothetical protein
MGKLKILHLTQPASFSPRWLAPWLAQYFDFVPWHPDCSYRHNSLIYVNCLELSGKNQLPIWAEQMQEKGFKILIDNLAEYDMGPIAGAHKVTAEAWFWYQESLHYQHIGLDQYCPRPKPQHLALMPMNKTKSHRTDFLKRLGNTVDSWLWSYVEQGRQLPNDGDMSDWSTQRRMNPEWYDHTYMSMVVESTVISPSQHTPVFITEKTIKPLAFWHPFVVYGNPGTLATLRKWGFETWDNLWDESYDLISSRRGRCRAIVDLVKNISIQPYDLETQRRLRHNRELFFNQTQISDGIIKNIIEPILEYAET